HLAIKINYTGCALRRSYSLVGQGTRVYFLELAKQKISRQVIERSRLGGYIYKNSDEGTQDPCFVVSAGGITPSLRIQRTDCRKESNEQGGILVKCRIVNLLKPSN